MKPSLSTRQAEVASYVAKGLPNKVIAHRTGLSIETVETYIKRAAAKIPGNTTARNRLVLWFFNISDEA